MHAALTIVLKASYWLLSLDEAEGRILTVWWTISLRSVNNTIKIVCKVVNPNPFPLDLASAWYSASPTWHTGDDEWAFFFCAFMFDLLQLDSLWSVEFYKEVSITNSKLSNTCSVHVYTCFPQW